MPALLHTLATTTGLTLAMYYVFRMLLIVGAGIVAVVTAPDKERHKVALDVLKVACRWRGGLNELK